MTMNKHDKALTLGRRGALGAFATVTGGLILRSLATGIPAQVLLDPLNAKAQEAGTARALILSVSSSGDPVNGNVPGTYGFSDVFHPTDPLMAETPMTFAGQSTAAAAPWANLPEGILDRACFFHHATYTPVHGEMGRVQRMMDATEKNDMLISLIARELAPRLGSVQADPVSLGANGGELLSSQGRVLANVGPTSVQKALGGVDGPLKDLTALRDESIDRIYALYKEHGTPSQRTLLESWARSRDEVRSISTELVSSLAAITGNDQVNQVRCAAVLAAMNITPVITLKLNFGGDNHTDGNLQREADNHVTSIGHMQMLVEELDNLRSQGLLKNDVIVGSLNVFGRTLKKKGTTGRDHNSNHHVTVLMGNGIKESLVGGIELAGSEYRATDIDAATGQSTPGGDIAFEDTLNAMGKTLGVALGVSGERMDEILPSGKVVSAAIG
ncbi:MAG: DUF1501 domain-containing protein [Myxococcales bacterium]|nr:DUF1501 domain-containing protein [Myxococcales bacterium]